MIKTPKVLILTGSLEIKNSSGMGKATAFLINGLSDIMPLEVIKSNEGNYKSKASIHSLNIRHFTKSHRNKADFDFLVSPYSPIQKSTINANQESSNEFIEEIQQLEVNLSEMEKVANYNEAIVELAQTMTFDCIYAHDWITFQAAIQLKLATGKKLILHVHSLEIDRNPVQKNELIFNLERKAMDYADKIITVSNYTKERIRKYYDIYPGKINVVYPIIEVDKSTIHTRKKQSPSINVLLMGRLADQKGILPFFKIAEKILTKNQHFKFHIVGEGENKMEIENFIHQSAYTNHFQLHPFLGEEEKKNILKNTDIFCLPSLAEPFGLSALEAIQVGIPTLLSIHAGISELFPDSPLLDLTKEETILEQFEALTQIENRLKLAASQQKNLSDFDQKGFINKVFELLK